MTARLTSPQPAISLLRRPWRAGPFSLFFAFTPLWTWIYAQFAWQTYFGGPLIEPIGPLGLPASVFFTGMVMLWMLVGVYALWAARSRRIAGVVYLVFTIPATFALIVGPAIVLIIQNLG